MGFLIVFGGTFLIFAGFVIYEKFFRKIDYNSIVARHIDRGGGHYFAQLKPKGNHVPWLWRYSWLDFKEKPL